MGDKMGVSMTGDELRAALRVLGWKQIDIARRMGMHRNTIHDWIANDPPRWAAEYVGAMVAIKRLHDTYLVPLKPEAGDVDD